MSRVFVTPKSEELAEAGALPEENLPQELLEGEALSESAGQDLPVEDFKALWTALQARPTEEVLEQIAAQFADAPGQRREVLTTWMAQELGYSRVWRRKSSLSREPLWDVLSVETYSELSERGEEALAMIAGSTRPVRASLHPSTALATLAIWRNSEDETRRQEAEARMLERALPVEPEWLFEVVGAFLSDQEKAKEHTRRLEDLVALTLKGQYWEVAALLSALALVHRYGRWYHSAVVSNLISACDTASLEYPQEAARWLNFMADAAMGGRLCFSWLERPLKACIRLALEDRERERELREFMSTRPFDADHRRLEELFALELEDLNRAARAEPARQKLLDEVYQTVPYNPTRALRLLEILVMQEKGRRVGSRVQKMRHALGQMATECEVDELTALLVGLYVLNVTLESHAAELVRRAGPRVDWENNPFADQADFEMYLVVSDYERAFEQLTCKFEGVTLEHADKFAAARIKYFVHKRLDPSRLHRLVQGVFTPLEWLGSGLTEIGFVSTAVETGMEHFEQRISRQDLRQDVLEEYRQAGFTLEDFDEISRLAVDEIEVVLKSRRQRRLLVGAVAGGISGGLAPFSWGVLSLADIPVLLSLTADICSRFCWYFGFDPREHPELPLEILAVALGGTRPAAIEPMLVRQNLQEYVTRKSFVVGAVAHGGIKHVAGRGLARSLERQAGTQAAQKVGDLARRAVTQNLQRRAVKAAPSRTLPVVGAFLGAALNAALLYDICEAAQAVLTDRFLERKYPEWSRHIAPASKLDQAATS